MSNSSPPLPGDGCPADPATALSALAAAVALLTRAEPARSSVADLGDQLVTLQGLLDAAAGAADRWTAAFAEQGGPDDAGVPTLGAWMRRELRLTPADARRRTRAAAVLDLFPATREGLYAGEIHHRHLDAIAQGVHQLGPTVFAEFEDIVLGVARACDADAVRTAIARIRDTLDPDAADAAHVRALERRDVSITPVGDGYALGGFLPADTGAMFEQVLYAAAKPASADDDRTAGQRRVDGLHDLCRSILDHGLPSDRGIRPHLFVTVDSDRLTAVTTGGSTTGTEPATLSGFGAIPDALLSQLACDCALTPILVGGPGPHPHVLDVGRTQRLATLKQRQAILVQQGGTCFNAGCDRTRLEIHHMIPWSAGGRTDLADLRGYCTRCHHLIHQGLLTTTPDGKGGWAHHTRRQRRLDDRRRRWNRNTARFTRDVIAGGIDHARAEQRRWRSGQPSRPTPTPVPRR